MALSTMKMKEDFKSHSFTDLPNSVQVKIFRYLNVDDLFRIGRTCTKLYFLSRDAKFWTRVDIGDFNIMNMDYDRIRDFLPVLPHCVMRLKLKYIPCSELKLTLPQLFLPIKRRCPELEVLVFQSSFMSYSGQSNVDFCIFDHLPDTLRVFACQKGELETMNFIRNKTSKLIYPYVVLDFSASSIPRDRAFFDIFTRMVNLRELRLANCLIRDEDIMHIDTHVLGNLKIFDLEGVTISHVGFNFIRRRCTSLQELYVCNCPLTDEDIHVDAKNNFESLEILCLRMTAVTDLGLVKIVNFCDSLQFVYVSYNSQLPRLITLPIAKRIKVLCVTTPKPCRHYSKRNYMNDEY